MNTIFVSIASMADTELVPTIKDILEKATYPEKITLSVFVQDNDPFEKQILEIVQRFKSTLKFKQVGLLEARGVGYARRQTQEHINPIIHKYYLQVDAHSRFIDNWDTVIIDDYEKATKHWGSFIYSVYPHNYGYLDGTLFYDTRNNVLSMEILEDDPESPTRYSGRNKAYAGNVFGELTNYFCGGFAFGYSEIFYNHKYDPCIFYNGEEPYMSISLYASKIKIVAPNKSYLFHDYEGGPENRRLSFFLDQPDLKNKKDKEELKDISLTYISNAHVFFKKFYSGIVNENFNEKLYNAHQEWYRNHVLKYGTYSDASYYS